jgi:hypothetical protein
MGTMTFWDRLWPWLRHPLDNVSGTIAVRWLDRHDMVMEYADKYNVMHASWKSSEQNEDYVEYPISSDSQTTTWTLPNPDTVSDGFRFAIRTPKGDEAWVCVWEGKHAFWERVSIDPVTKEGETKMRIVNS